MGRRASGRLASIVFCLVFLLSSGHSLYLPGFAPRDFTRGDELQVKVNKLSSHKTKLAVDFYFLKYCKPKKIHYVGQNLGEVLRGLENSVYTFHMRENLSCIVACKVRLDNQAANDFKEKINEWYRVHMVLDNLPVAVFRERGDRKKSPTHKHFSPTYEQGFRVGFKSEDEKYYINNHLSFRVMYHKDPETDSARIVGFEVSPRSINHEYKEWNGEKPNVPTCNQNVKMNTVGQTLDKDQDIVFSYDVSFEESHRKWASRWYTYLLVNDDETHWFSIIISLMIVLFLSGMVAKIMIRILKRDIANYNQVDTQDEAEEETGWIVVHGDVYRAPLNSGLLCIFVGTGVQIHGIVLVTILFALLVFVFPSEELGLMSTIVGLWCFTGVLGGYMSASLYQEFKPTNWIRYTLKKAFVFPGALFSIFSVLYALVLGEKSGTMFALVCKWFGVSVPLVFVGSCMGFNDPAFENQDPEPTNTIPRQIPEQAWYMKPIFSILIGGILLFGAVFFELFFILTFWSNQFYYVVGFLFLVYVILVVTSAEIAVVLCYFQLRNEDYNWWWRPYLTAGSSALYLFLYSAFYFFTKLEITNLFSGILYFGYMLIASYAFFMWTGTIGFCACDLFVETIYMSLWIDSSDSQGKTD